ncbi:MAG: carboxypeptidase-like regulatory domain-containing protein, partial [Gemmatimonadales bacterium]
MRWIVRASRAVVAAAVCAVLFAGVALAQGVTTASLRGRVADQTGSAIVGASILLTNTSTGQRYQALT